MPINIETLKTRALTALIFVALMLTGLLWNEWSYLLLFTIIHAGCWHEFVKLIKLIYSKQFPVQNIWGVAYITLPVICMIVLYLPNILPYPGPDKVSAFRDARLLPCAVIFSIWINDTMAYLVGSVIGKTPFSKISPKKTWEGTTGGALLCVITITLLGYFLPVAKSVAWVHWAAIAAICAVFGTVGDLLESKLKRLANVKDSGSIMPGHGGFLDRFDSLLIAAPAVYLYATLFL